MIRGIMLFVRNLGCLEMYNSGQLLLELFLLISFMQKTSTQMSGNAPTVNTGHKPLSSTLYMKPKETRVLICRAQGDPPPRVTWLYNDQEAHPSIVQEDDPSIGTSIVKSITATEFGRYKCRATNKFGTVTSRPILIEAAVLQTPESAIPAMLTVKAKYGDTVSLECMHNLYSAPQAVSQWYKGGSVIPNSKRIYTDEQGHLWIRNLDQGDTGDYTCQVKNLELSKHVTVTTVEVRPFRGPPLENPVEPYLKNNLQSFVKPRGETAKLYANVIDPSNLCQTIKWERSDGLPLDMQRIFQNVDAPQILKLVDLKADDLGYYLVQCRRTATTQLLGSLFLHVVDPARIFEAPKFQEVSAGSEVAFTCRAKGDPAPSISWQYNDSALTGQQGQNWVISERGEQLKLLNVVRNASVTCKATNDHGFQTARTTFNVYGIPPNNTNTSTIESTGTTPTIMISTADNVYPSVSPSKFQHAGITRESLPWVIFTILLLIVVVVLMVIIVIQCRGKKKLEQENAMRREETRQPLRPV